MCNYCSHSRVVAFLITIHLLVFWQVTSSAQSHKHGSDNKMCFLFRMLLTYCMFWYSYHVYFAGIQVLGQSPALPFSGDDVMFREYVNDL